MIDEIWRDVEGFEGRYTVSNHGRIKSFFRCPEGKIMKLITHTRGYQAIWFRKPGVHKKFFVHRLVAIHFLERGEDHDQVNHKDKNRLHNHVMNLEWCTWEENYKHRDGVVNNDEPF
jgi:hypothetical protein